MTMSRPNPETNLLRTPEQPARSVPNLVEASPFTLFTKQLPPITPPRNYGANNFTLPLNSPFSPGSLLLTSPLLPGLLGVGYPEQYLRDYTGGSEQQVSAAQTPVTRDSGIDSDRLQSSTISNSWQLPSPNVPLFVPSPRKSPRLMNKSRVSNVSAGPENLENHRDFETCKEETPPFAGCKLEQDFETSVLPEPRSLPKFQLSSSLLHPPSLYANGFPSHHQSAVSSQTYAGLPKSQDQESQGTLYQQAEQFVTHMRKRSARRKLLSSVSASPAKAQRLLPERLFAKRPRDSDTDEGVPSKNFKMRREHSYNADFPTFNNRETNNILRRIDSESSRAFLPKPLDAGLKLKQEPIDSDLHTSQRDHPGFSYKAETSSNYATPSEGEHPTSARRSREAGSAYTDSDSAQYSSEPPDSPRPVIPKSNSTFPGPLSHKGNKYAKMAELAAASVRRPSKRQVSQLPRPPSPTPLEGHIKPLQSENSDGSEDTGELKRCSCKRSKCLKLYCDCFAAGSFCNDSCGCVDCENTYENRDIVEDKRGAIKQRNPQAFQGKILKSNVFGQHVRGCNCKKSHCRKKYCECFQGGVACGESCKCIGCQNTTAHLAKSSKSSITAS